MMRALGTIVSVFAVAWFAVACSPEASTDRTVARVVVGTQVGSAGIAPAGVPADPDGLSGVVTAALTVLRGGAPVHFDATGTEVDEVDGVPIVLSPGAASVALSLVHGTYDFEIVARDDASPPNDLADGAVRGVVVHGDVSVQVPLISTIGSAEFGAPVMVLPNEVVDVFLTVRPPNRTDLRVPTSDFDATYDVAGAAGVAGFSDLGVRVIAVCDAITVVADVVRAGDTEASAQATSVIGVDFLCPPSNGTVGVDLIPPFVTFDAHVDGSEVAVGSSVLLSGVTNDAQSGVASVDLYDGVVLLGSADIVEGVPSTWSFAFTPDAARPYFVTAVATDNAGNQSRATTSISATQTVGPESFAVSAGGAADDRAHAISTLADGGAIVAGRFSGTATFGDTILSSTAGSVDVFVAKASPDGTWSWATHAGGSFGDYVYAVSALSDGSAIITGYFQDAAAFGTTTLTSVGGNDVFVAKINPDGTWAWATRAGGVNGTATSVSTLSDGRAIITGNYFGTATFGDTTLDSAGGQTVFVAKTHPDGTWDWATSVGGTNGADARGVSTLSDGSAIVTGSFFGTAAFGDTVLNSAGSGDVFAAKANPDGTWAWASSAGGTSIDVGVGVSTLSDGSAIITGTFSDTASFGATELSIAGSYGIFIAKTDVDGSWAWATSADGTSFLNAGGVSVHTDGSATVAGDFNGSATFGTTTLTSVGNNDVFSAKVDADGSWQWATRAGGTGADAALGLGTLADGGALATGFFSSSATFGGITLSSAGSVDVFVAKIGPGGQW